MLSRVVSIESDIWEYSISSSLVVQVGISIIIVQGKSFANHPMYDVSVIDSEDVCLWMNEHMDGKIKSWPK